MEDFVIARLYRGPFDGEIVGIPEPWPVYVIPDFTGPLVVQFTYLLADEIEDGFAYLYDDILS